MASTHTEKYRGEAEVFKNIDRVKANHFYNEGVMSDTVFFNSFFFEKKIGYLNHHEVIEIMFYIDVTGFMPKK